MALDDLLVGKFFETKIECPCQWAGTRKELRLGTSKERFHPKNRSAGKIVHITSYEACPKCGRWMFADGVSVR